MDSDASAAISGACVPAAILIVDDTPPNIGLLHAMLQPLGHRLYAANSGLQALDLAERIRPDLILLDVMMPGLDGFATCRQLKARPHLADVPVIFITACNDADQVVTGFQAGAADYIAKPIRVEEVLARVRTQLTLRRCRQQEQAEQLQLQALVEGMREGLLLLDPQGCIRYSNPALQQQLGHSAAELLCRPLSSLRLQPELLTLAPLLNGEPSCIALLQQPEDTT